MATPKAYGLTGNIATGKTTAAHIFESLGVPVIYADDIAHELYQEKTALVQEIVKIFGKTILDEQGNLDRQKLANLVFQDEAQRKQLEKIVHPKIIEEVRKRIRTLFDEGQPLVLVEAALLFESGYDRDFHGTLVVTCSEEEQMRRLCRDRGMPEKDAKQRMAAQMPLSEKVKRATLVLENTGTLDELREKSKEVYEKIKAKVTRKVPLWH